MARENLYSRLVAWLKILLPLVALAILSSVVFFARDADDYRSIPFITEEGGTDTPPSGLKGPEYVGVTTDGAAITMRAREVRPVGGDTSVLDVGDITGTIASGDGRRLDAAAPEARIDLGRDRAEFRGQVRLATSDGFSFVADGFATRLDATEAETGALHGTAPFGRFDAGGMRYTAPATDQSLLLFNNGVKLVYEPPASGGPE